MSIEDLHYYASLGNYFEVCSLVSKGVDPDGKDPDGITALMLAVQESHSEVVELLISLGADIHCCDPAGWSLLHIATYEGSLEIVKCLVNKGVALEKTDRHGKTALMLAVQESHIEVVELLISLGADIHCCDPDGWTLLHFASLKGPVEIVQCLVNNGTALEKKDVEGKTALMFAVERSLTEVIEVLINSGSDIHCSDDNGLTLLHYASYGGSMKTVQCLVNNGIAFDQKDFKGMTPTMAASTGSRKEVVELLVNLGADIHCCDGDGWTLMHYASCRGSMEIVQFLVNKGVAVDKKDYHDGDTPLHVALNVNKLDIAVYLLKEGADCNLENKAGETPFSLLIQKEIPHVETFEQFIEKGAYVNSTDDYNKLLGEPTLKKAILQNVKLCSQVVINKFNKKELPLLYKRLGSVPKFPHIDIMMIGNRSGMALEVTRSVTHEIQAKGHCNILQMVPLVLGVLCVKYFIQKRIPLFSQTNPSESQNGLKRSGSNPEQDNSYKKLCN